MKTIKTALLVSLMALSANSFASMDCHLGEVAYMAFNYETENYTEARGQMLPIAREQALYALLGTNYGGDGYTTFALPKIDPIQTGNGSEIKAYICTRGLWPSRK